MHSPSAVFRILVRSIYINPALKFSNPVPLSIEESFSTDRMPSPVDLTTFEKYPLQAPPAGQTSNFTDPATRGPAIVLLCSVSVGIM